MGRGHEEMFLQRGHTDGQQAYEKMLNVTNHQGNANQNHNEIPPYTCWNGYINKTRDITCWRECGEKGTLIHCWWECRSVRPLWWFLKKLKIELSYNPAVPLLAIYPKKTKTLFWKDICTPLFIAVLFTITKT